MAAYAEDAGRRIRDARERNRPELSQEDLAHELGVTVKTVGRWERGESEPRGKQWDPLARALRVDVEDLRGQPPIAPEQELRQQLDRIERQVRLVVDYFNIEADSDGEPITRFREAFEARRVLRAAPGGRSVAKRKRRADP